MSKRLSHALFFSAVAVSLCAALVSSYAAPLGAASFSLSFAETSSVVKVQQGCGWDYPCPPRPWYGSRSYRTPQVNIENNYGTVNVYQRRKYNYGSANDSGRWSDGSYEWRDYPKCEGDSCRESCGVMCWLRRIRDGYCGHGCDSYRESEERYYRDYGYPPPPPPPYADSAGPGHAYDYEPRVRYERPGGESVPLHRFQGPKYPPN
jgi:hypothetical protein